MATEEGWGGVENVAAHLRVAKDSVYRWVSTKGFPVHRTGLLLRFRVSVVDESVKTAGASDSHTEPR